MLEIGANRFSLLRQMRHME